ncbi:MAG: AraC family transcriptional regulator [Halopseudomonas sp.]|uniref:AraC family transcriptional regulator n=1 Tax=Halopseudomonas sp. TaxID=2901191 RepID=UPI003002F049
MPETLLQAVDSYASYHANANGLARTPVPGLTLVRSATITQLEHAVARPLLCLILQGGKQVTIGAALHSFKAGDSMLLASNMPTASRIVGASRRLPYLAVALDLDIGLVTELTLVGRGQSVPPPERALAATELKSALHRLVRALDHPSRLAALQNGLLREIHYWLLLGPQGEKVRQLGLPDSHARRIARAVALLRANYQSRVPIARLAAAAGMSRSALHQHFRATTSLSPLQFQKQLRLTEARRLIQTEGKTASRAAFDVGYESISQFNREYARLFDLPPMQDKRAAAQRLID